MEDENEVQVAKEIDFCTMGMFIIGKRGYFNVFMYASTALHRCIFHAKPSYVCIRASFQTRCQVMRLVCTLLWFFQLGRPFMYLFGGLFIRLQFQRLCLKSASRSGDCSTVVQNVKVTFYTIPKTLYVVCMRTILEIFSHYQDVFTYMMMYWILQPRLLSIFTFFLAHRFILTTCQMKYTTYLPSLPSSISSAVEEPTPP